MAKPERQLLSRTERQAAILRGAARAFARAGFQATSMEDIAAASGITKLIVYRHFASKEELYRRVLELVHDRHREVFLAGLPSGAPAGIGVHALLAVAREEPDAFVLLWRHAAREPVFADYVGQVRERAVAVAERFLSEPLTDPVIRRWAAETIVAFLVESTLTWLVHGDERRDGEFEQLAMRSVRAMVTAWVADPVGG